MFKHKTTDEATILKASSIICLLIFLLAGNGIAEKSMDIGVIIVGFGVFSSALLMWMGKRLEMIERGKGK